MILTDHEIRSLGPTFIGNFNDTNVQNICYDLETACFIDGREVRSITLSPLQTVFVRAKETIQLPNDIIASISLRNSRLRQGLAIDAPIYQPGHRSTVYFRITNMSEKALKLDTEQGIASIIFERLEKPVDKPYEGAFQDEDGYKGLSTYEPLLAGEIDTLTEKVDQAKEIERTIYGNVLQMMAIFVGIFSLVNVNITSVLGRVDVKSLLSVNLSTVGAIAFLLAAANVGKSRKGLIIGAVMAFLACLLVQLIL